MTSATLSRTTDRATLRLSAVLLLAGVVVSLLAGLFHADRERANDHPAAFAEYAASDAWTAAHLGQFAGMALIVAGLIVLFTALGVREGAVGWLCRLAAVSAVVALALYGVLQGVDGVALKQAVDAWAAAPDAERATRFANAETVRWLEWGIRSYQSYVLGTAFILFGVVIAWTRRVARPIGYLMVLSGLAYLAQGWVIGTEGFSDANTIPSLAGIVSTVAWTVWLFIAALRAKDPADKPAGAHRG